MPKMEWQVYYFDCNRQEIGTYNALSCETAIRQLLKKSATKDEFSEALRKEMMCRYWSKAEWEIILSPWCGGDAERSSIKIDVYNQLMMNWPMVVDYCWSFKRTRPAKSR